MEGGKEVLLKQQTSSRCSLCAHGLGETGGMQIDSQLLAPKWLSSSQNDNTPNQWCAPGEIRILTVFGERLGRRVEPCSGGPLPGSGL